MTLEPEFAVNLRTGEQKPITDFIGQECVAIAGIGHPPRFFNMLENLGVKLLKTQGFADHQAFEPAQLKALAAEQIPLLMTEKDAGKMPNFCSAKLVVCTVSAKFSPESTACLLEPILKRLGK
ncbi:tetraacyldisaccharide 4'-kinase [Actinobacillus pleuropneumoniae]|nr:tetraacyldisaccharide 4'-kinase [Actinobacillus pleuropneumoniae]